VVLKQAREKGAYANLLPNNSSASIAWLVALDVEPRLTNRVICPVCSFSVVGAGLGFKQCVLRIEPVYRVAISYDTNPIS